MKKRSTLKPMSNADILLSIDGLPGLWAEMSGIGFKMNRPKYSDPQAGKKLDAPSGSVEHENLTLKRPFDPENPDDQAVLEFVEEYKSAKTPFTLNITPIQRSGVTERRGTRSWIITDCKIASFKTMESLDVGGGNEVVKLVLEISYSEATWR
jgi:hypothetical protein